MTYTITFMSIAILTLLYGIYNSLRKIERLEDAYTSQRKFINDLTEVIAASSEKLKEIDDKGAFSSDDEIGCFFENVKTIQEELNTFNTNDN